MDSLKIKIKFEDSKSLGLILFYISLFLLASAPFISTIFLFISLSIGFYKGRDFFLKNKLNIFFFICGILIIISGLIQFLTIPNNLRDIWDPKLTMIGMLNWIPFFCFFWTSQIYLNSEKVRKNAAIILIAGSLPVLITGLGQYFLNWVGPFKSLNGLIVWYQKPITVDTGLSGLFSNQNYAAAWLLMIWPFSLALILEKTKNFYSKLVNFSFLFLIFLSTILTNSRSAWGGLLLSFPIIFGINNFSWILPLLIFLFISLILALLPFQLIGFQNIVKDIFFNKILIRFSDQDFGNLPLSRTEIWTSALDNISINPFFGTGAGSFPNFYGKILPKGVWVGHPHNIFFELAISYGIPVGILTTILLLYLFIASSKKLKIFKYKIFKSNVFDNAWWCSAFIFFILQIFDIQYFDLRLSILFWILVSGLINIVEYKKINSDLKKL